MKLLTDQPADKRFVASVLALCALSGVLTSAWCLYIDDVINNDGMIYVRAAELLASSDWTGVFDSHQWPFFSLLMLLLGKVLGISYQWAGHLLNAGFFTASSVLFVLVVRAFGGTSQRLTVFAALVAVMHPAFNEYRAFIIRDAGYLTFYLAAIWCLARSVSESALRYRIGVVIAFAIASLFRIEGVVFLLSTPLLLSFTRRGGSSPWLWLLLLAASAGLLAVVLGWWLLAPNAGVDSLAAFSRPLDVVANAWQQTNTIFAHKITVLREEFLGQYAKEYAWALFSFAVLMILVSAMFSQLTIPWALLVLAGVWSGVRFPHKVLNRLWASLLGMHLAILLVFTLVKLFLVARYPLALSVTALLLVPLMLERALGAIRWHQLKTPARALVVVVALWGVGESVSGVDNVTRSRAVKDAGLWLASHTSTVGSLVSNDQRIAYYAGRYNDRDYIVEDVSKILHRLRKGLWPDAIYVAFRLPRSAVKTHAWVLDALGNAPEKVFESGSGDRVLVYLRP